MTSRDEPVTVDVDYVHETDAAYLLSDGGEAFWVPKALATLDLNRTGRSGELTLPAWKAEELGLI